MTINVRFFFLLLFLACSLVHVIVDSYVCPADGDWPPANETDVVTMPCPLGLAGQRSRTCGTGGIWSAPVETACPKYCPTEQGWNQTRNSMPAVIICPTNASLSATRMCSSTGQWQAPMGGGCSCAQDGIWTPTDSDNFIVMDCPNGQQQAWSRYCNLGGIFGPVVTNCSCPADAEWNMTLGGTRAVLPCPYQTGVRIRDCDKTGIWSDVGTQCPPISCPAMVDAFGNWSATPAGGNSTLPCPDTGIIYRECNASGHWQLTTTNCSCSAATDTSGTWPTTLAGQSATLPCPDTGIRYRGCNSSGQWKPATSNCSCSANGGWPQTTPNRTVSQPCPYSSNSTMQRTCLANATWGVPTTCPPVKCPLDNIWNETLANRTATFTCSSGGTITRLCLYNGTWAAQSGECPSCPADGVWEMTNATAIRTIACPNNDPNGSIARQCSANATWLDPFWLCHCLSDGVFNTTLPNVTAVIPCPNGVANQIISRDCLSNGTWAKTVSNCSCPVDGLYSITPANTTVSIQCDAQNTSQVTRFCNGSAIWEPQLGNCSKTCPTDGIWNTINANTIRTIACANNDTLGSMARKCAENGTWLEPYSTCRCPAEGLFNATLPNVTAVIPCPNGVAGQFISRECLSNSTWASIVNNCSCPADGLYATTAANTTVSIQCDAQNTSQVTRFCNASALWEPQLGNCSKTCPADGIWDAIEADAIATIACANNDTVGSMARKCSENGTWLEPYSSCQCPTDGIFNATSPNVTAVIACPNGVANQFISRQCLSNSTWASIVNNCSCPADGLYSITPANTTASIQCDAQNTSQVTRFCNASALWEPQLGNCSKNCSQDGIWPETLPGGVVVLNCTSEGTQERTCDASGSGNWSVVQDNCLNLTTTMPTTTPDTSTTSETTSSEASTTSETETTSSSSVATSSEVTTADTTQPSTSLSTSSTTPTTELSSSTTEASTTQTDTTVSSTPAESSTTESQSTTSSDSTSTTLLLTTETTSLTTDSSSTTSPTTTIETTTMITEETTESSTPSTLSSVILSTSTATTISDSTLSTPTTEETTEASTPSTLSSTTLSTSTASTLSDSTLSTSVTEETTDSSTPSTLSSTTLSTSTATTISDSTLSTSSSEETTEASTTSALETTLTPSTDAGTTSTPPVTSETTSTPSTDAETTSTSPIVSETTPTPSTDAETTSTSPIVSETTSTPPVSSETTPTPSTDAGTTSTPPIASESTSTPPVSSETTPTPSTDAETTSTSPIVSETTSTPPVSSETTPTPSTDAGTTSTPPIASESTSTPPVSSETTPTPSTDAETTSTSPIVSETTSTPPVSSETTSTPPVASDTTSTLPVSSETTPTPSTDAGTTSTPPVASDTTSTLPVSSETTPTPSTDAGTTSTPPVASDTTSTLPVSSETTPTPSTDAGTTSTSPIVSETTPTPPIATETTSTPSAAAETTSTPPTVAGTTSTPPAAAGTTSTLLTAGTIPTGLPAAYTTTTSPIAVGTTSIGLTAVYTTTTSPNVAVTTSTASTAINTTTTSPIASETTSTPPAAVETTSTSLTATNTTTASSTVAVTTSSASTAINTTTTSLAALETTSTSPIAAETTSTPPAAVETTSTSPTAAETTSTPPVASETTSTPLAAVETTSTWPIASETTSTPPAAVETTSTTPAASETTSTPPVASETTSTSPITAETTSTSPIASETTSTPPVASETISTPPAAVETTSTSLAAVETTSTSPIAAETTSTSPVASETTSTSPTAAETTSTPPVASETTSTPPAAVETTSISPTDADTTTVVSTTSPAAIPVSSSTVEGRTVEKSTESSTTTDVTAAVETEAHTSTTTIIATNAATTSSSGQLAEETTKTEETSTKAITHAENSTTQAVTTTIATEAAHTTTHSSEITDTITNNASLSSTTTPSTLESDSTSSVSTESPAASSTVPSVSTSTSAVEANISTSLISTSTSTLLDVSTTSLPVSDTSVVSHSSVSVQQTTAAGETETAGSSTSTTFIDIVTSSSSLLSVQPSTAVQTDAHTTSQSTNNGVTSTQTPSEVQSSTAGGMTTSSTRCQPNEMELNGVCSFTPPPNAWQNAVNACLSMSGAKSIVSLHIKEEWMAFNEARVKQLGPDYDNIWIGLNYSNGMLQWWDGSNFDENEWAQSETYPFTTSSMPSSNKCIASRKSNNYQWSFEDCNVNLAIVCYAPPFCPAEGPWPSTESYHNVTATISCSNVQVNYTRACLNGYWDAISLDACSNLPTQIVVQTTTSVTSPVNATTNESNRTTTIASELAQTTTTAVQQTITANESMTTTTTTTRAPSVTCNSGEIELNGVCIVTPPPNAWQKAVNACLAMNGRSIVVLKMKQQWEAFNQARQTQLSSDYDNIWIGLQYKGGRMLWSDGSELDESEWSPTESYPFYTTYPTTNMCVASKKINEYKWSFENCDDQLNVICYNTPFCPVDNDFPSTESFHNVSSTVRCSNTPVNYTRACLNGYWDAISLDACSNLPTVKTSTAQTIAGAASTTTSTAREATELTTTVMHQAANSTTTTAITSSQAQSGTAGATTTSGVSHSTDATQPIATTTVNAASSTVKSATETMTTTTTTTTATPSPGCNSGEELLNGVCTAIPPPSAWDKAVSACAAMNGKSIVALRIEPQWTAFNSARVDQLGPDFDNIWIGLKYSNGKLMWSDGSEASESDWSASGSFPFVDSMPTTNMCVASKKSDHYNWSFLDCDTQLAVVCYSAPYCELDGAFPKTESFHDATGTIKCGSLQRNYTRKCLNGQWEAVSLDACSGLPTTTKKPSLTTTVAGQGTTVVDSMTSVVTQSTNAMTTKLLITTTTTPAPGDYLSSCGSTAQCKTTKGLTCSGSKCVCPAAQVFVPDDQCRDVSTVGYGQTCDITHVCGVNLVCTSGTCVCNASFAYNGNTCAPTTTSTTSTTTSKPAVQQLGLNEDCSKPNTACDASKGLSCGSTKKCVCTDQSALFVGHRCQPVDIVGHHAQCDDTLKQCDPSLSLICSASTLECICENDDMDYNNSTQSCYVAPTARPTDLTTTIAPALQSCPRDGQWLQTVAQTTAIIPCLGGFVHRSCNSNGVWGAQNSSECKSYWSDPCSENGPYCTDGAACLNNVCSCPTGQATYWAALLNRTLCITAEARVGATCSNGEACQQGSYCFNGVCTCLNGTTEYNSTSGITYCVQAPVCGENQVAISGICVYVFPKSTDWQSAKNICADDGSQLAFVKEEADWKILQAARLQLRKSNPSLDRIWIGFEWDKSEKKYLYADETEYANDTDWLPTPFFNELTPRYPNADASSILNCASSSSSKGYDWTFTDCSDPSYTAMCYITPNHCAQEGEWERTQEFYYQSNLCLYMNAIKTRECKEGGIWGEPDDSQCIAFVGDPCQFQDQCQGSSVCIPNRAIPGKQCTCLPGYVEQSNSDNRTTCKPSTAQIGESCFNGQQCVGGSVCDSSVCQCTLGMTGKMVNGTMQCVAKISNVDESCANGEICVEGSVCNGIVCKCGPTEIGQVQGSSKVCVAAMFCDATALWKKTKELGVAESACPLGGIQYRTCLAGGNWGAVDARQCMSYVTESCTNQDRCMGNSTCLANVCSCPAGTYASSDLMLKKKICIPKESRPGDSCKDGEICTADSQCFDKAQCSCPSNMTQVLDPATKLYICAINPCLPSETFKNGQCLIVDSDPAAWNSARDKCNQAGSVLVMPTTKAAWTQFQATRLSMLQSKPKMANIWIGLQYSTSKSAWVWADGKTLTLNTNQWIPWSGGVEPSQSAGNCIASMQDNNYMWTAHDCADTVLLGVCYQVPSKCPTDGAWPSTAIGSSASIPCQGGQITRACQIGGIWSLPAGGGCSAYAGNPDGDSCKDGQKCQSSSYCGYASNSAPKTCICSAGYIPKLNPSTLQYDCILQEKYVGETCFIAPQCQAGSLCDSPTCRCPAGLQTEYDTYLSKTICVGDKAYVGESCSHGETCSGGSVCRDGECACDAGKKAVMDNSIKNYVCTQRQSYLGETCGNDEICVGGSDCNGTACDCLPGRQPQYDNTIGKHLCVREMVLPTDSCASDEICGGGSACVKGVCTCEPPYTLVSNDGQCVGNFSEVGDHCDRRSPCHPLTQAICFNNVCTCINPLYHDLDFDVCRSSNMLGGRGTQEVGEQCDAVLQCRSDQLSSCVKGICACTKKNTFREGKCLAPGVCVTLGTYWDRAKAICRLPIEGEKCSISCDPAYIMCNNGICKMPDLGEKCSSVCANQTTMACVNSNCACRTGYTQSKDGHSCEEYPAHPGENCSPINRLCGYNSTCNLAFKLPMCQCSAYQGAYNSEEGMRCEPKRQHVGETCANKEICSWESVCDRVTKTCVCPPGSDVTENKECLFRHCDAENEWPQTNATRTARLDCVPGWGGKKLRKCFENTTWAGVVDVCIMLKASELQKWVANVLPNVKSPEVCSVVLDVFLQLQDPSNGPEAEQYMAILKGIVEQCPLVGLDPTEEAELDSKYDNIMNHYLSPALSGVMERSAKASTELVFLNEQLASQEMKNFFNRTINDINDDVYVSPNASAVVDQSDYFKRESYIIRPGQPWPAENDKDNALCELTEEMLRSPELMQHRVRFGMMCAIVNITVPIVSDWDPPPGAEIKAASTVISVTTTLDFSPTRDLMVRLRFPLDEPVPVERLRCGWLQRDVENEVDRFSTSGCVALDSDDRSALCSCTHMTNYALLMQIGPGPVYEGRGTILTWLTRIVFALSLLCLFITGCVLLYVRRYVSQGLFILRNMCCSLFLAQLGYLIGIHFTDEWLVCRIVAVVLHYFFLAVFTWMFCLGIYLVMLANKTPKKTKQNRPKSGVPSSIIWLIGYAAPAGVVAACAALNWEYYGGNEYCWLQVYSYLPWTFVGPAAVITLISVLIALYIMGSLSSLKEKFATAKILFRAVRGTFIFMAVMAPLLGLTWAFGSSLLADYFNNDVHTIFEYVFVSLEGLQGLFFFILIVLLNDEVRYGIYVQRYGEESLNDNDMMGGKHIYIH